MEFEIKVMSDVDYEDLIAEVLFKGESCLLLSQEEGFERMRVTVHPRKTGEPWDFSVIDLKAVLELAASRLWDLRKNEA